MSHVIYAVMIGESGCMDSGIHSLHHTEAGAITEAERVNAERRSASGYLSRWDRAHVEEMEVRS